MTKLDMSILEKKNTKVISSEKALKNVESIKWESQGIVVGCMQAIRKLRGVNTIGQGNSKPVHRRLRAD